MRGLLCALALAIGIASASAAAQPQDPTGEFRGVIQVRKWTYDVGLRVRRTPDGYAATFDWITLDLWNIPLEGVAASGGPVFARKAPQGTLVARFDPQAGWRAEWRRWGEVFPVQLHRAPLPPAPLLPRPDRNVLLLLGALIVLQGAGIARLLQLRGRRRRKTAV